MIQLMVGWMAASITTNPLCVVSLQLGDVVEGVVHSTRDYGVFVRLPNGTVGLLHISRISHERVDRSALKMGEILSKGDRIKVRS